MTTTNNTRTLCSANWCVRKAPAEFRLALVRESRTTHRALCRACLGTTVMTLRLFGLELYIEELGGN